MNDVEVLGSTVLVGFMDQRKQTPKILRSVDNGKNWEEISMDVIKGSPKALAADPNNGNIVYAAVRNIFSGNRKHIKGYVMKSIDGGASWTRVFETKDINYLFSIFVDPSNSDNVYFGSNDGMFRSADKGKNWKKIRDGRCESVFVTKTGDVYGLCAEGIVHSDTKGNSWSLIFKNQKLMWPMRDKSTVFHKLIVDDKNLKIYAATNKGLLKFDIMP